MRLTMLAIFAVALVGPATTRIQAAIPASCSIEGSHKEDASDETRLRFEWKRGECDGDRHCSNGSSDMPWNRWSGITPEDLQHEGSHNDARMRAESGEMRCVGTVHSGVLTGEYSFTPDEGFRSRMEAMGFNGLSDDTLQGYAMLDVTTEWVKGMQQAGVEGMTAQKLMGLRALKVDSRYIQAMAAAGYPEMQADKLTSMKAVGVSPEKVAAIRKMGYSPTQDELIQMCVFKIDAPFVERMRARGFENLTIAQLVKIKIFKLDE